MIYYKQNQLINNKTKINRKYKNNRIKYKNNKN